MVFIERLQNALQQNNSGAESIDNKRLFFGEGFSSNALAKKALLNDVWQKSAPVEEKTPITYDNIALINPGVFISKYLNKAAIDNAIIKNPEIEHILKENNLSLNYNLENVKSIINSHLIPTAKTADKMYLASGHKRSEDDYTYLIQAALLHDIGKIFIPEKILNKKGKLTSNERDIIELHNRLSYEILKTTDLNPKVAHLAYEHHNYDKKLKRNELNQILTIADTYSALREKRTYKPAMNDVLAKSLLYDMGTKGNFDTRYIKYLNSPSNSLIECVV